MDIKNIKQKLKNSERFLKEKFLVKKIGVFGSYARNEASPNSDLDLMVWFKEQKSLLGVIRIERELSELLGVKIDLLTEQAVSPHLIDRIRNELKVISS